MNSVCNYLEIAFNSFQMPEFRHRQQFHSRPVSIKVQKTNAFLVSGFWETHRKGGAAITDMRKLTYLLRHMKMTERHIIKYFAKNLGPNLAKSSNIELAFALAFFQPGISTRKQMPHGNYWNMASLSGNSRGFFGNKAIMIRNSLQQFSFLVLRAFARRWSAQIFLS